MCSSSRVPAFGLIGTIGTPAASAPTTATTVSSDETAQTATREAPATRAATAPAARRQLRVGQRVLTHPHGLATVGLLQTFQEHDRSSTPSKTRETCRSPGQTMPGSTTTPRALVVDDAPENRMLVSALLAAAGLRRRPGRRR